MSKYLHGETLHNLKSPQLIVPEVMKLTNPKSVVDFGCGLGTFLNVFKQHGVSDVLGLDGPWVNKKLLHKYIEPYEFQESNLEEEIKLDKKYDLVVSLEVAEHLSPATADTFVQNLVNAGNVILFSAAIPNQEGQNHLNEQWLTYWEEKFQKHGLVAYDVIRPLFWDNAEVFWWYRQNTVLFAQPGFVLPAVPPSRMKNVVHYELYDLKCKQFENLLQGKQKRVTYFKLFAMSMLGYKRYQQLKVMLKQSK